MSLDDIINLLLNTYYLVQYRGILSKKAKSLPNMVAETQYFWRELIDSSCIILTLENGRGDHYGYSW